MSERKNGIISQHVLELRYPPYAHVLDIRGHLANQLSQAMNLSEWFISENRVDVYDKLKKNRAFVGFRNCGFICTLPDSGHYFQDQATKFVKKLYDVAEFSLPPVTRLGVRSILVNPHKRPYQSLVDRFRDSLMRLGENKQLIAVLDDQLVDVSVGLNFSLQNGYLNMRISCARADELKSVFEAAAHPTLPEIGLSCDVDYFEKDLKSPTAESLSNSIALGARLARDKFEGVSQIVLGGIAKDAR